MKLSRVNRVTRFFAFGCLSALCCLFLQASALAGPLATASNALNNGSGPDSGIWRGSTTLSNSEFTAIVDFAVFNPGDFETFINTEFPGLGFTDPSANRVVYAFQIEVPNNSPGPVQRLNAGFDVGVDVSNLPTPLPVVGSGDTTPAGTLSFNSSSAVWDWGFADSVGVGQSSDILYYTSILNPQPDQVTVAAPFLVSQVDSGRTDFASPNPLDPNMFVPEPSTAGLMLLAVSAFQVVRRRR